MVDHRDRFPRRSRGRIILSRLGHRTLADDWARPVLVGGDSAGDFFTWPLVGWRGQHSHRIRSRLNPNRILSLAPRSGRQHDRSRSGGFRCQRPAKIVFLTGRLGNFGLFLKAMTRNLGEMFPIASIEPAEGQRIRPEKPVIKGGIFPSTSR
jgi:hypothetical protein